MAKREQAVLRPASSRFWEGMRQDPDLRYRCTLCRSLKVSDEFPLAIGGGRKTVTCTQCLKATLDGEYETTWAELGLLPQSEQISPELAQQIRKIRRGVAKFTCRICAEEKPQSESLQARDAMPFPSSNSRGAPVYDIPFGCNAHLILRSFEAVCKECLSMHLVTQLHSLGAEQLSCIESMCNANWSNHALEFLDAKEDRDLYTQQRFDAFWRTTEKWSCPDGCDSTGMCLVPVQTMGYPHVECYGCRKRFCCLCRVPWHEKQTCQQFRNANPDLTHRLDEEDEDTLRTMAKAGARRCPLCQMIILKDGGCNGMQCEKCDAYFNWSRAERVRGPGDPESESDDPPIKQEEDEGEEEEEDDDDDDGDDEDMDTDDDDEVGGFVVAGRPPGPPPDDMKVMCEVEFLEKRTRQLLYHPQNTPRYL